MGPFSIWLLLIIASAMLRLIHQPQPAADLSSDEPEPARARDPLHALVSKVIGGDRKAERTLLIAVGPAVLGVVKRVLGLQSLDIDDVCQEASLGLLAALPSFRAECTVLYFACRVALLTALAARRRRDVALRPVSECVDESEDIVDVAPSPAEGESRMSAPRFAWAQTAVLGASGPECSRL